MRLRFQKSPNHGVIHTSFILAFTSSLLGLCTLVAVPQLAVTIIQVCMTVICFSAMRLALETLRFEWSTGEPVKPIFILKALYYQGPLKRAFKNFFVTGNAWGLFSKHAHINKKGTPKIGRSTMAKARKMADDMEKKTGYYYSAYFCPRCGTWHIGKNRDSVNDLSKHLIENNDD